MVDNLKFKRSIGDSGYSTKISIDDFKYKIRSVSGYSLQDENKRHGKLLYLDLGTGLVVITEKIAQILMELGVDNMGDAMESPHINRIILDRNLQVKESERIELDGDTVDMMLRDYKIMVNERY